MSASGKPLENKQHLEDQCISVRRKYFTPDHKLVELNEFKQGNMYIVGVTINALREPVKNIMILYIPCHLKLVSIKISKKKHLLLFYAPKRIWIIFNP